MTTPAWRRGCRNLSARKVQFAATSGANSSMQALGCIYLAYGSDDCWAHRWESEPHEIPHKLDWDQSCYVEWQGILVFRTRQLSVPWLFTLYKLTCRHPIDMMNKCFVFLVNLFFFFANRRVCPCRLSLDTTGILYRHQCCWVDSLVWIFIARVGLVKLADSWNYVCADRQCYNWMFIYKLPHSSAT